MKAASFHGFLVIDKPGGITSRDAVDRAQRWFPRGTRLGHTGTLDPLATGLLVLAVGDGTRLTEYVQRMEKTYLAGLRLGVRSDTDDFDGTVTPVLGAAVPERAAIENALPRFIGAIDQVPPAYSAAHVAGRRAYDLARRGVDVQLQPRRVHIHALELRAFSHPRLELEVRCGKGTYIRSLARDLGERLGCGACVESLRRTCVGPFEESAALPLNADADEARAQLLPLALGVKDLPCMPVTAPDAARLCRGQAVRADTAPDGTEAAVFDAGGALVAIVAADGGRQWRPVKVLAGCR